MNWTRLPQERNDQQYLFSGQVYCTKGVQEQLHPEDIMSIYRDVHSFAMQKDGIDYLQVYTDGQRKIFVIDSLDKRHLASGEYGADSNYCTILFAEEY